MANNIEVILTGKDAGFTDTLNKAAATLNAKNTEMINSLGGVAKAMGSAGTASGEAGAAVSASATKYTALSEASKNLAAGQILARTQIKELGAAIKAGSVDAIAGRAAILELQAATRALGSQYAAAARGVASGASDIVGAHSRMGVSGQLMMHSVRSAGDSFAAGLPPMMIFSEQLGRLSEAAAYAGGGTGALGKIGAFMGGPWGIAVTAAISILGTMLVKMKLFGDEVQDATDKLVKQAHANDIAKQAQAAFDLTVDGSLDKMRKLNEELERRIKNQAQLNNQQTLTTGMELNVARGNVPIEQAKVDAARKARDDALSAVKTPIPGAPAGMQAGLQLAFERAEANFLKAQEGLAKANAAVIIGERDLRAARAAELQDQAKGIADPRLGAKQSLEAKQGALNDKFLSGGMTETAYRDGYARIQGQIDALTKQASASAENSLGQMVALIKKLFPGAVITSTTNHSKYTADGNISDHSLSRAIDFVPAGGMSKYSSPEVEKMLKDAGVTIRRNAGGTEQFFGPGMGPHGANDHSHDSHFHVAWTGSASPEEAERRAAEAARKTKEEQDRAARRAKEFADAGANLDKQLLEAKKAQTVDIGELAQIALQEVKVANDKFTADVHAKEKLGDLTKAQVDELLIKEAVLSALKAQEITVQETQRKAQEALRIQTAANDNDLQLLHLQEQMAVTQAERRKIQLAILDKEKQNEINALERRRDDTRLSPEERQIARNDLAALPAQAAAKADVIKQQTEGPLGRYIRDNDPRLLKERVESLEVQELENVRQGIDDAITKALGIKDPFLKGIIDLFIQTVLIDPIARALQKATASGSGGLGSIIGAVAGIFGGKTAALNRSFDATFPGHASGTLNASPGYAWVGENGPELLKFRGGEQVFNQSQLSAANGNTVIMHNDFRGADAAAVAGISAKLNQLDRSLESRSIVAVADARERRIIR